jgi:hypothetical protein
MSRPRRTPLVRCFSNSKAASTSSWRPSLNGTVRSRRRRVVMRLYSRMPWARRTCSHKPRVPPRRRESRPLPRPWWGRQARYPRPRRRSSQQQLQAARRPSPRQHPPRSPRLLPSGRPPSSTSHHSYHNHHSLEISPPACPRVFQPSSSCRQTSACADFSSATNRRRPRMLMLCSRPTRAVRWT